MLPRGTIEELLGPAGVGTVSCVLLAAPFPIVLLRFCAAARLAAARAYLSLFLFASSSYLALTAG